MSTAEGRSRETSAGSAAVDLKLETVGIPLCRAHRTKAFFVGIGWRLDADTDWSHWYAEYMVREQTGQELPA